MIAIVDYDMGNLRSVQKGIEKAGAEALITRDPGVIAKAGGLVLPGVGAFGLCMEKLEGYSLASPIKEFIASGRPFLGICLGLQLLFEESAEFGSRKGLGILKGQVVRFPSGKLKVPHMGWNTVKKLRDSRLFEGINDGTYFYFVHSYYVEPANMENALATTEYGPDFVSAVEKENIFATQFHPEKSDAAGLKMLENFARLTAEGGR